MISKANFTLILAMLLVNVEVFAQVKTLSLKIYSNLGPVSVELHGKVEDQAYLERIAVILEEEARPILDYFEYPPTSTVHMIVDSLKTVANGLTRVFPTNHITYYRQPPLGEGHLISGEEFLRVLVLHEFVHVVHLDQTRDFPGLVRTIFGSVGKIITSIVPRWFSEGIATWAETRFTKGGRMRLSPLRMELNNLYLDPKFCSSIDCLDDPGVYPYGQYAYWIGGDFFTWLEERKEGTVRCLVHQNSGRIPFFLNNSFKECMPDGLNAEDTFLVFRKSRVDAILAEKQKTENLLNQRGFAQFQLDQYKKLSWQQGSLIQDDKLIAMTQEGDLSRLTTFDLTTGKSEDFRANERVSYLQPFENTGAKEVIYSASTYHDDDSPRKFYQKGQKQSLELVEGDYLFNHMGTSFHLILKDKKWKLMKGEEPVYELPELFTLTNPRKIGDRIYFISYLFDDRAPYQVWSIGFSKDSKLKGHWVSDQPIHFLSQCEDKWLVKIQTRVLQLNFLDKKTNAREVDLGRQAGVSWMRGDYVSFEETPGSIYKIPGGCQNIKFASSAIEGPSVEEVTLVPLRKSNSVEVDSYPSFRHFLPHYWMIGFVAGTSADGITATTGLNDPMEKHYLDLSAKYYTELKKRSADISYTYSMSWFDIGISHLDFYTKSYLKNTPDKNESNLVFVSKDQNLGNFDAAHNLSYSESKISDIFSQRETETTRYSMALSIPRILRDDLLQFAYWDVGGRYQKTLGAKDFFGSDTSFFMTLRPAMPYLLHLKGSYSKFYKDGLASGGIFAGGEDQFLVMTRHSYLGLEYNDAFGNEIWTARLQNEFELTRSYRGWGMFPLFMKKVSYVLGAETLHADNIYLSSKKRFVRGNQISNVHTGLRFDVNLFYLAPVEYELLFVKNEYIETEMKMFLKTSLSF
ncbi:MAG: hypothetical protein Fur0010_04080 [Bdellovibrio sp.]